MTQEDKQLLLKDLCARLPYGVKVNINSTIEEQNSMELFDVDLESETIGVGNDKWSFRAIPIIDDEDETKVIKPYLRPLSSITREEELHIKLNLGFYLHDGIFDNVDIFTTSGIYDRDGNYYPPEKCRCTVQITIYKVLAFLHYLHSHHFDYNGLIEKGLALEAPEDMYQ